MEIFRGIGKRTDHGVGLSESSPPVVYGNFSKKDPCFGMGFVQKWAIARFN
jgi:hypothetical protein